MKSAFTLILLFCSLTLFSQETRTVSGVLTGDDGLPLVGVNILIKNSTVGTVSDSNGYYELKVPIGSTLIFSSIGMNSREVLVTNETVSHSRTTDIRQVKAPKPHVNHERSFFTKIDTFNTPGVYVLSESTPTFKSSASLNPKYIRAITTKNGRDKIKIIKPPRHHGFGIQLTTSATIKTVNSMPRLQQTYVQGQPQNGINTWFGADQNEIFSWGPLLNSLEFDGVNYPYDQDGQLVQFGTGSGIPARRYDNFAFFRNGFSMDHSLGLSGASSKFQQYRLDLTHKNEFGIIPNSKYETSTLSAKVEQLEIGKHMSLDGHANFNYSRHNLPNHGSNLATTVGSLYRTPISFDNANGIAAKMARRSSETYQNADGSLRSHAPGYIYNPWGIVQLLPDQDQIYRFTAALKTNNWTPDGPFELKTNIFFDGQWGRNMFGVIPGLSQTSMGMITQRRQNQTKLDLKLSPSYYFDFKDWRLTFKGAYNLDLINYRLQRRDGSGYSLESFSQFDQAANIVSNQSSHQRRVHQFQMHTHAKFGEVVTAYISLLKYFSNTLEPSQHQNFYPSVGFSLDLAQVAFPYDVRKAKINIGWSRSLREAPLLYNDWSYASTRLPLDDYDLFYESDELTFQSNLVAETHYQFETGIDIGYDNFDLSFSYFTHKTEGHVAPVWNGANYELLNVADLSENGLEVSLGYYHYAKHWSLSSSLNWSAQRNRVVNLTKDQGLVPIAGFNSIQSVLATGQPLGAIYGTSYLRDAEGRMIIDSDGFPIEDHALKKIGDPTPDWVLGWDTGFQWRRFELAWTFSFKKGGDLWNGTDAVLDYLGRSLVTAEQRGLNGFLYEGADHLGQPNSTTVNFADPNLPLGENRWVRYGWDGVGEAYIEDASWVRLSRASFSYTLTPRNNSFIRQIELVLSGTNLFVITPYSGVDPETVLFGKSQGTGLDLFNTPSVRSYSAKIILKI